MSDPTEAVRRQMVEEINAVDGSREHLEAKHGQVWDTSQHQKEFDVLGFMAPFVVVFRIGGEAGVSWTGVPSALPQIDLAFSGCRHLCNKTGNSKFRAKKYREDSPHQPWGDYVAKFLVCALIKSGLISDAETPCRFRKIGGTGSLIRQKVF